MELMDRVSIVTGGGSGLGEATCKLYAKNGSKVVVADNNLKNAKRVADEIVENGGTAIALEVNVANRTQVNKMVADTIEAFGRIEILVNNAGITRDSSVPKMTQEQWDEVIAVNLTGVFNCISATVPHMITQKYGRIINVSSVVGIDGGHGQLNYSAAKAGVIGMTVTMGKELANKGIRTNAIAPGFIATDMVKKIPDKIISKVIEKIPMGELGLPNDIAEANLFLASDKSGYMNGRVLRVDGGIMY